MRGQPGFFDIDDRLKRLSDLGDQLETFRSAVDFELFRPELNAVLSYTDRTEGGRPPFDPVLMFKILVIQLFGYQNHVSIDTGELEGQAGQSAFRLLAMDVADEAILVQERLVGRRSVGGIGPHPARRIALVEQALAQTTALIGSRICGRPSADEAETAIDRNMVLIAKERDCQIDWRCRAILARFGLAQFDRPVCVAILVPQLGRLGLPIRRYPALFDRLLLVVRIALPRRRNQAAIDDLTRHGDVTSLPQHGIELLEQSLDRSSRGQLLPERSKTNRCWKNSSPQKHWKYGFSTQRSHSTSSDRL